MKLDFGQECGYIFMLLPPGCRPTSHYEGANSLMRMHQTFQRFQLLNKEKMCSFYGSFLIPGRKTGVVYVVNGIINNLLGETACGVHGESFLSVIDPKSIISLG